MRAAFVILLSVVVGGSSFGQTTGSGKATTSGICSPATTGNNNTYYFKYCGSDPEQGKKIIELLNQALAGKDPAAINLKLDELIKIASRPAQPVCDNNTLTNCVAGDNYGSQTVNGFVPPPPRQMTTANAYGAIALLRTAPTGSRVRFMIVGGEKEINGFAAQVVRLFNDTNGGWAIDNITTVGQLTSMGTGPDGNLVSHGEGFHCSVGNPRSGAGEIAIQALAKTGYPCLRDPDTPDSPAPQQRTSPGETPRPVDLYVTIGTRIIPPN
jgi:hypothetical protein